MPRISGPATYATCATPWNGSAWCSQSAKNEIGPSTIWLRAPSACGRTLGRERRAQLRVAVVACGRVEHRLQEPLRRLLRPGRVQLHAERREDLADVALVALPVGRRDVPRLGLLPARCQLDDVSHRASSCRDPKPRSSELAAQCERADDGELSDGEPDEDERAAERRRRCRTRRAAASCPCSRAPRRSRGRGTRAAPRACASRSRHATKRSTSRSCGAYDDPVEAAEQGGRAALGAVRRRPGSASRSAR